MWLLPPSARVRSRGHLEDSRGAQAALHQSDAAQIAVREPVVVIAQASEKGFARHEGQFDGEHGVAGVSVGAFLPHKRPQRSGLAHVLQSNFAQVPHGRLQRALALFVAQSQGRQQIPRTAHPILVGQIAGNHQAARRRQHGNAVAQLRRQAVRDPRVPRRPVGHRVGRHRHASALQHQLLQTAARVLGVRHQFGGGGVLRRGEQILATAQNQVIKMAFGPGDVVVVIQVMEELQRRMLHGLFLLWFGAGSGVRLWNAVSITIGMAFIKHGLHPGLPPIQVHLGRTVRGHIGGTLFESTRFDPKRADAKVRGAHGGIGQQSAREEGHGVVTLHGLHGVRQELFRFLVRDN